MAWWSKPKAADEPQSLEEEEPDPAGWAADPGDEEPEEPDEEEPEVSESRLEKALQERVQGLRERLATRGLDLSDEGEPLIRDPKRFRDWARPAVAVPGDSAPPAVPAAAVTNPEPAPLQVRDAVDAEVWEMTPADLRAMIREEAEKIAKPVVDQLQQQRNLIGKRWVDDATQKAADALQAVAPDYMHILDHPQFEELFKKQLSNMPPEWLESPQVLASTALGLVAWMDHEQMPERRKTLDDTAARALVNRAGLPQRTPAPGQSGAYGRGGNEDYAAASRWLANARIARVSPEEIEALDATDERGLHTIDQYVRAKKRIEKMRGKR